MTLVILILTIQTLIMILKLLMPTILMLRILVKTKVKLISIKQGLESSKSKYRLKT